MKMPVGHSLGMIGDEDEIQEIEMDENDATNLEEYEDENFEEDCFNEQSELDSGYIEDEDEEYVDEEGE